MNNRLQFNTGRRGGDRVKREKITHSVVAIMLIVELAFSAEAQNVIMQSHRVSDSRSQETRGATPPAFGGVGEGRLSVGEAHPSLGEARRSVGMVCCTVIRGVPRQ